MNLTSRCLFPRFCSADPNLVNIGVLWTLSGSMSNWGQSARDGLIIAQESINTSATHNEPRVTAQTSASLIIR
jgi:ABC-type branched-subunit amino acid transport system substrate-binding protein